MFVYVLANLELCRALNLGAMEVSSRGPVRTRAAALKFAARVFTIL